MNNDLTLPPEVINSDEFYNVQVETYLKAASSRPQEKRNLFVLTTESQIMENILQDDNFTLTELM